MTVLLRGIFFLLLIGMTGPAMAAGERIALVIGNSSYKIGALPNPRNDALLMSATLKEAGFTVTELVDVGQDEMKRAIREFGRQLREDGVDAGLFYYAGHGVQVKGENYLIPVDAQIQDEDEVELEGVNVNAFLQVMNSSKSKINIVILDACRNNPFQASSRSLSRGLAPVDAPTGTFIAYSTAPGTTAADGDGTNSAYTAALASSIKGGGSQPIEGVFKDVRRAMIDGNTGQVPWEASSIVGDFYFKPQGVAQPQAADEVFVAWNAVKDSANSADYRSFLDTYGERNLFLKQQAERRLRDIESGTSAPAPGRGEPAKSHPDLDQRIAMLRKEEAPEPRPIAQRDGWTLYGYKDAGNVKCWAWRPPAKASPKGVVHAAVQFGIDKLGTQFTPSLIAPEELKLDAPAKAEVGGETFLATPAGNVAYFAFSDSGKELVRMLDGDVLKISATLTSGKTVSYEFATDGLPGVLKSMEACD